MFVHVTHGRGSVARSSAGGGFVDDVTFARNGPVAHATQVQRKLKVIHGMSA